MRIELISYCEQVFCYSWLHIWTSGVLIITSCVACATCVLYAIWVVALSSPRQILLEDYEMYRVVSYCIQYMCVCIFLSTSVLSPHPSFNILLFKCCVLPHTVWLSKQKPDWVIEVKKTVSVIIPHKNHSSIHSSATHMIAALSYYGVLPRHQSRFHHHVKHKTKQKNDKERLPCGHLAGYFTVF